MDILKALRIYVAVARMLGINGQPNGSSFPDCPALEADDIEVCDATVLFVSPHVEKNRRRPPLHAVGTWDKAGPTLRVAADSFFEEHCKLFHHRPFILHIWDGRKRDGFHELVNYHRLAGKGGRKLLESLTYSYLGEWLTRQQAGVKSGEEGAEDRLAAALELRNGLKPSLTANRLLTFCPLETYSLSRP